MHSQILFGSYITTLQTKHRKATPPVTMKISIITVLAVITSTASAFVAPSATKDTATALNMALGKSKSVPFLRENPLLKGVMVGDVGFDPLQLAENPVLLENYREAEIRHCRIAMLGAAGWPMSELFDRSLANTFKLDVIVDSNDRAPSILNGGLGKISPYYWAFILGFAGFIEAYTIQRKKSIPAEEYFPGNLGFDPLNVYPKNAEGKKRVQLAEIKNGRLAMIAAAGFAIQEAVNNEAVIDQTPMFFKPFGM